MFEVAVAHSNDPATVNAVDEVLAQCAEQLAGRQPQGGVVFASIDFDHAYVLKSLKKAFPDCQIIGCTTDGEMSSVLEFQQDSLTLMLFISDQIRFLAGLGVNVSRDPAGVACQAVTDAMQTLAEEPKLCITMPESLTTSSMSILEGVKRALGDQVPIVGGLAADQWRFDTTYQFCGDQVATDAVPFLLLAGDVLVSHGVAGGWRPVGNPCQVGRVEENVVFEIDGMPALDYYHKYLGARDPSSQYPLAVYDGNHFYLRAPSGEVDKEVGSVTFFGDIPERATVQMTEASRDDILTASESSMRSALSAYPGEEPAAALYFSCASRRQILGSRTREEFQRVHVSGFKSLPGCGFYTNGEIAPLGPGLPSHFHNETFISVVMGVK